MKGDFVIWSEKWFWLERISRSEKIIVEKEKMHWQFFALMQLRTNKREKHSVFYLSFVFNIHRTDKSMFFHLHRLSTVESTGIVSFLSSFQSSGFSAFTSNSIDEFLFSKKDLILTVEHEFVFSGNEDRWFEEMSWMSVCLKTHSAMKIRPMTTSMISQWRFSFFSICSMEKLHEYSLVKESISLCRFPRNVLSSYQNDGQNKRFVLFYAECQRENNVMGQEQCWRSLLVW